MYIVGHKLAVVAHACSDDAFGHDLLFDGIDVAQIMFRNIPLYVTRIIIMIIRGISQGWGRIRLPVNIPHRSFLSGEISSGHQVVAAFMDYKSTSGGRISIIVIVLVKTVPPIEMVFGEVWFARLSGRRPVAGHQQIAFHSGHGPMRPAGAALLAPDPGHIIASSDIAQIVAARRVRN